MDKNTFSPILVLGATGMVGSMAYQMLKAAYGQVVVGTARVKNGEFIPFAVGDSIKSVLNNTRHPTKQGIIFNCLGYLRQKHEDRAVLDHYIKINTAFPHELATEAKQLNFQVVHISTDAVFPADVGRVTEDSQTLGRDAYGTSKLNGEVTEEHFLTIRTSPIGPTRDGHGLYEWAKQAVPTDVGYRNQDWAGCTTRQLAELFVWLCQPGNFKTIRARTSILHFAPIGPFSKYQLINSIRTGEHLPPIKRGSSDTAITTTLSSNFAGLLPQSLHATSLVDELRLLYNSQK